MAYKEYQKETIKRITDSFKNENANSRFIDADEVGLGKTFVAKGVIRTLAYKNYCEYCKKQKEKPYEKGNIEEESRNGELVFRFKVLYLCSNLNIAEQNKKKLGLSKEERCSECNVEDGELAGAVENRLTMLYLQHLRKKPELISAKQLAEQYRDIYGVVEEPYNEKDQIEISILPITPKTSIKIKGTGHTLEREFILRCLSKIMPEGSWPDEETIKQEGIRYEAEFENYSEEAFGELAKRLSIPDNILDREAGKIELTESEWEALRKEFARATLECLEYDLVILDEFQNFMSILEDANKGAEAANYDRKQRIFIRGILQACDISDLPEFIAKWHITDKELTDGARLYQNSYKILQNRIYEGEKSLKDKLTEILASCEKVDKKTEQIKKDMTELCYNGSEGSSKCRDIEYTTEQEWTFRIVKSIMCSELGSEDAKKAIADFFEKYMPKESVNEYTSKEVAEITSKINGKFEGMAAGVAGLIDRAGRIDGFRTYIAENFLGSIRLDKQYYYILSEKIALCKIIAEYYCANDENEEEVRLRRKLILSLMRYCANIKNNTFKNVEAYLCQYFAVFARNAERMDKEILVKLSVEATEPIRQFAIYSDKVNPMNEDSEEDIIVCKIFAEEEQKETKILMLSATPFKMYLNSEEEGPEDAVDVETERCADIKTVCDFLDTHKAGLTGKLTKYKGLIEKYADEPNERILDTLKTAKGEFEREMATYFSRMERQAVYKRWGEINGKLPFGLEQTEDEKSCGKIKEYVAYVNELLELQKYFTEKISESALVRFATNAPYAFSFMHGSGSKEDGDGYKAKRYFDEIVSKVEERDITYAMLTADRIKEWKPLGLEHGVFAEALKQILGLEDLENHNQDNPGAAQLLWVPSVVNRHQLKGVFAKYQDFGKTIMFSRWVMVPRMFATLCSYETQRRLRRAIEIKYKISPEKIDDLVVDKNSIDKKREIKCEIAAKYADDSKIIEYVGDIFASAIANIVGKVEIENETIAAIAKGFLNKVVFNNPVGILAILSAYVSNESETAMSKEGLTDKFPMMFRQYCEYGQLQSVIEEWIYMQGFENTIQDEIINFFTGDEKKTESIFDCIKSSNLQVDVYDKEGESNMKRIGDYKLYTHYCRCLGMNKDDDKISAIKNLRNAFNTPFMPFVFATTSMGQEGLDFHYYADRIIHWNLPSNPVDFEQREGRINRYRCLIIRKKLVEWYGKDLQIEKDVHGNYPVAKYLDEAFAKAKAELVGKDNEEAADDLIHCGMIPDWILLNAENGEIAKIKRIVPYFLGSRMIGQYNNNLKVLELYRSVIGQADPDEIMERLMVNVKDNKNILKDITVDFSPYAPK